MQLMQTIFEEPEISCEEIVKEPSSCEPLPLPVLDIRDGVSKDTLISYIKNFISWYYHLEITAICDNSLIKNIEHLYFTKFLDRVDRDTLINKMRTYHIPVNEEEVERILDNGVSLLCLFSDLTESIGIDSVITKEMIEKFIGGDTTIGDLIEIFSETLEEHDFLIPPEQMDEINIEDDEEIIQKASFNRIIDAAQAVKIWEIREKRRILYEDRWDDHIRKDEWFQMCDQFPEQAEPYYRLGNVHFEEGEFDIALGYYTKAIAIKSHFVDAVRRRGDCYYALAPIIEEEQLSYYKQALIEYLTAIALVKDSYTLNAAGLMLELLGKNEQAINYFTQAIEHNPDYPESYFNRARILEEFGQGESAISDLEHYLSLDTWHDQEIQSAKEKLIVLRVKNKSSISDQKILQNRSSREYNLERTSERIQKLVYKLRKYILGLDPSIKEISKKFYIAYKTKTSQNIVCIEVQVKRVIVYLNLKLNEIKAVTTILPVNYKDVSQVGHYGTGDARFSIQSEEDIEIVKPFIEMSYQKLH